MLDHLAPDQTLSREDELLARIERITEFNSDLQMLVQSQRDEIERLKNERNQWMVFAPTSCKGVV